MNLLRSEIEVADDRARLVLFGQTMELPVPPGLDTGRIPAIIGIRPEHLRPGSGSPSFSIVPRAVERLGSEQLVYVDIPPEHRAGREVMRSRADEQGDTLIVRIMNGRPVVERTPLPVEFDAADLHIFDVTTGHAIRA